MLRCYNTGLKIRYVSGITAEIARAVNPSSVLKPCKNRGIGLKSFREWRVQLPSMLAYPRRTACKIHPGRPPSISKENEDRK